MGRSVTYLLRGRGPEQQLVDGLVRGEAASYRQLYEAFSPRLRRILWRIHRDPQLVEDALQITFMQVFRCVPQFNGQSSLLTWMAQIALNEARRMARRQTRTRQIEKEGVEEAEGPRSPEHHSAAREEYACLTAAVDALPLEKRTALLLFEIEGFSVQEIADMTGEPRGTILARLSRTRAELRQAVQTFCGAARSADPEQPAARGRRHGHT